MRRLLALALTTYYAVPQAILLALFIALAPSVAHATTAASCNIVDINSAISATSSGGTVIVPSGSCTWSSGSVSVSGKSLTIQSAGTTNITDTSSGTVVNMSVTGTNFVEFGNGINITSSVSKSNMISVDGANSGAWFQFGFWIHGMTITSNGTISHILQPSATFGLINHNIFNVTNTGSIQSISPFGTPDGSDGGFTAWQQPLSLGSGNAVFIEDNVFNYPSAGSAEDSIDGYAGSRIVIRFNQFNNAHIGFHGTDSGNRRSLFSFEIYNNAFVNNTASHFEAGRARGGTGVWYNNTYSGPGVWTGFTLINYRNTTTLDDSNWQRCNTTSYSIGSTNFSSNASRTATANTPPASSTKVFACQEHPDNWCTATGGGCTCTYPFDGAGSPTAGTCRDQPGITHDQALEPIYGWNNGSQTLGPGDAGEPVIIPMATNIATPRNYVNNGTTPKPGYTAFTYPYPLGSSVVGTPTFSPLPGTYSSTQNVALSTTTPGATICYTVDGSTPTTDGAGTCTHGSTYSTLISVATTTTVKAIGSLSGSSDSVVASGTFTINAGVNPLFVNNSGSPPCSDTGGQSGDSAHPFCTVTYGISRMASGNTLTTLSGTYAGDFTITGPSGVSSAHTIIQCQTGNTCILNGPGTGSGRIKISHGCAYMDFTGFTITNHNQGLYLDDDAGTSTACTNLLISGITVHDVGQEGIAVRAGATGSAPRNFVIQNSLIYNTGLLAPAQNGEGIYLGNSSGPDTTNGVTVINNTIHDTSSECIELKGDSHDNIIDGNNLSNCITSSSTFGNTGGAIEVDEPRNTATNPNQIIRNNTIHDLPNNGSITKRGIRLGTGATAYNNLLYSIGSSYTCILANTSNFPRVIYNNTVDCTTGNAIVTTGTTSDVQNNIGPPSAGNNLAINSSYFIDYAAHNYRLASASAPIGAGANLLATVPTDILGITRTLPMDLGAYKYAAITLDPPTFNPGAGNYAVAQNVTINTTATGATLCYTLDGTPPTANGAGTCTHGTTYSTVITISVNQTIKAVASRLGDLDSAVGSADYVIGPLVPTPTNAVGGIKFSNGVTVR